MTWKKRITQNDYMMEKKYRLTDETIIHNGKTLYRIKALRDFGNIKKGDRGGFVEDENNLSQEGNCWIYNNAKVFSEAVVSGDARIKTDAEVYDYAVIEGHAFIGDAARVYEMAVVSDNAVIRGNSKIHGEVNVTGNAYIIDAETSKEEDYIVFKNWWSSGRYFTWTRCNNMWRVGYFYGTGKQLIAKAYKDSELSGREYERIVRYVEAINQPTKKLNCIQKIICKLFKIK